MLWKFCDIHSYCHSLLCFVTWVAGSRSSSSDGFKSACIVGSFCGAFTFQVKFRVVEQAVKPQEEWLFLYLPLFLAAWPFIPGHKIPETKSTKTASQLGQAQVGNTSYTHNCFPTHAQPEPAPYCACTFSQMPSRLNCFPVCE